jgi:hypothetical protein
MKKETPDGLWAITSFFNPMACCRVQINQSYTAKFENTLTPAKKMAKITDPPSVLSASFIFY